MPLLTTHSEELQEIMGRIPSRVVRRGTVVIFSILVVILVLSYLVKYPEMVAAPITITTLTPPADLMAKSTGRIEKLFVRDGQQLAEGDLVAVLFNIADYDDVFTLERLLGQHGERWQEWVDSGFAAAADFDAGELRARFHTLRRQRDLAVGVRSRTADGVADGRFADKSTDIYLWTREQHQQQRGAAN